VGPKEWDAREYIERVRELTGEGPAPGGDGKPARSWYRPRTCEP